MFQKLDRKTLAGMFWSKNSNMPKVLAMNVNSCAKWRAALSWLTFTSLKRTKANFSWCRSTSTACHSNQSSKLDRPSRKLTRSLSSASLWRWSRPCTRMGSHLNFIIWRSIWVNYTSSKTRTQLNAQVLEAKNRRSFTNGSNSVNKLMARTISVTLRSRIVYILLMIIARTFSTSDFLQLLNSGPLVWLSTNCSLVNLTRTKN